MPVETLDGVLILLTNPDEPRRSRAASVFTDVHFWVPVAVLLAGLLLLRFFH